MGFFRTIGTVVSYTAASAVGSMAASAVLDSILLNYMILSIFEFGAFIVSTLLFIPGFAVTDIIASLILLVLSLVILVIVLRICMKAISLLMRRGPSRGYGYHSGIIGCAKNAAISEVKSEIPIFVILLIIKACIFALVYLLFRKTVIRGVEDIGLLKLIIYPTVLSFDTIFGTSFAQSLAG